MNGRQPLTIGMRKSYTPWPYPVRRRCIEDHTLGIKGLPICVFSDSRTSAVSDYSAKADRYMSASMRSELGDLAIAQRLESTNLNRHTKYSAV
jgi:hypothetical protein